jgi:hypothetical protein
MVHLLFGVFLQGLLQGLHRHAMGGGRQLDACILTVR